MSQDTDPTLERYRRKYDAEEAKFEAMEEKVREGLAAALRKKGDTAAKEFIEYSRSNRSYEDRRVIEETMRGGNSMNETTWGDDITGEEEGVQHLYGTKISPDDEW